MPSMSSHMAVACNICDYLGVNKEEFIKGNLLPDLYDDKNKSHFKIQGKKYYIPDIEKAINSLDINNNLYLGYLSHLLLDKYYFDEYLLKYEEDLFQDNEIYKDYDVLSKDIVNHFNLDVDYLKSILKDFPKEINKKRLKNNLKCLALNIDGNTKTLDKEEFIRFLEEVSNRVKEDLKIIIRRKKNG